MKWGATGVGPKLPLPGPVEAEVSPSRSDAASCEWPTSPLEGACPPFNLSVSGWAATPATEEVVGAFSSAEVPGFPAETSGEDENAGGADAFCDERSLPIKVVASPLCTDITNKSFLEHQSGPSKSKHYKAKMTIQLFPEQCHCLSHHETEIILTSTTNSIGGKDPSRKKYRKFEVVHNLKQFLSLHLPPRNYKDRKAYKIRKAGKVSLKDQPTWEIISFNFVCSTEPESLTNLGGQIWSNDHVCVRWCHSDQTGEA